jgi:hypothetical protein
VVEEAIQVFEKALGAKLNSRKSSALPIRRWKTFDTVREIAYRPSIEILGLTFWNTIHKSRTATWTHLTSQVRTVARESYSRELSFTHRIQYVHAYLLAKIWFAAQIFVVPSHNIQLTTAITYFIGRGSIFRVPVNVLRTRKTKRGWELIDIFAKYRTLLLCRLFIQGQRRGMATAAWLKY